MISLSPFKMFKSVVLLLVVTPILVSSKPALRIAGGRKALNGSAPHQVSLRNRLTGHFCGGSIVTSRAVLTAAHCVEAARQEYVTVVVGTNQLNAGGQNYSVSKMVAHEKHNIAVGENDVAIIFTDQDIQFSDTVRAVELNEEPLKPGEELRVTGWGLTSYPGKIPNDLMELDVQVVSYEECKAALDGEIPVFKTQVCALAEEGKGACKGDSGGPLVAVDGGQLVGIVSEGVPCATGVPDVYTSVQSYISWIKKTLSDNSDDDIDDED